MTHELAKQLKDAGFPQAKTGVYVNEKSEYINAHPEHFGKIPTFAYVPTLDELIDWCGDEFFGLSHWPEGWTAEGGPVIQKGKEGLWTAQVQCKNLPTAKIAVAHLGLALQRK